MKLREWNAHLHGLVVFRALLNDPVVARLLDLTDRMEAGCSSYGPVCDAVAAFEAALFEYTTNWGSYLSNAVLEAETICVRQAAAGQLDALLQSCRTAFAGGYSAVKLYFMLGLPTETDEDVLGIADVAARVMHAWRESAPNKQRGVRITVSTSWFVPKPHTAFQWEPQISKAEYERRVALLRDAIKTKTVTYNWHDSDTSFLEAVLARGDRRMGKVLETAWRKGAHLDAWEEYFSLDRWLEAFDACGLDPHFYANRTRSEDELLPWSMISSGVTESYLKRERRQAYASVTTPDCRTHCNGCGANKLVGGKCDV